MMAVDERMTVAGLVSQVCDGRLDDFVREAVARHVIEAEITGEFGVDRGEVAPEQRATHRNEYRHQIWETKAGGIDLLVPRKRFGDLAS